MKPPSPITDLAGFREREAIERCRAGGAEPAEGLETLYELYARKVHRTCIRILGDEAAAEDLTQEIFLELPKKLRSFRWQSQFSTWLYRVAVNRSLNASRSRSRRRRRFLPLALGRFAEDWPDPEPSPADRIADREARDRAQRLLGELSPSHRAAIVLREVESLSYQEIAEVLGVPIGTVMSRLSRARQQLRARWEQGFEGNSTGRRGVQSSERSTRS